MSARKRLLSPRYLRASRRVADVEALLARQVAKITELKRLGFDREADTEQPLLIRIEELLRLCVEDRDRVSRKISASRAQ